MSLAFVTRTRAVAATASALLVASSGLGLAQQQKATSPGTKGEASQAEKIAGVILKVEKVAKASTSGAGKLQGEGTSGAIPLRLSVNTNAVWRDWARDQARTGDAGSARKDAAKGDESVATKGQPADENSVVVIEVEPGTRIETRFRSPTDETTRGVDSPAKVKSDEATKSTAPATGKPVQFRAGDLAPGLFIEVDFKTTEPKDSNKASVVTVIRPIQILNASPDAQPGSK